MRWEINTRVPFNSFQYFEKTMIAPNGFREYDLRWLLGKEINPNGFVLMGRSYGTYLLRVLGKSQAIIGHDFRAYSQNLSFAFIVGLLSSGVDVIDIGLAITPMVYFAQHHLQCDGAAAITASHNENGWTGIKLAKGLSSTLGPDDIQLLRGIVEKGDFESGRGEYRSVEGIFDEYLKDILKAGRLARLPKVVFAAGNGTAGLYGPAVLRALGCDVVELHCEGDWDFPNHNPNPEDVAFLKSISEAIKANGAEIGIGIDGDGDRIGVVDDQGREVFSDKLGLLIARWICPKYPNRSIVIDVKSTGLFHDDPILKKNHCPVITWKTGHSYIKAKVAESHALAGFEKSGHWFFNDPLGRGYDDALGSAAHLLRMLVESGHSLSSLVDALPKTWQSPTLGVFCADNEKYKVVEQVVKLYEQDKQNGVVIGGQPIKELVTVNGVRFILQDDSWGLVRASSNKPSLVIVAESNTSRDQLYDIVEHIQARLAGTGKIGEYDQQMEPR
ncbi:MAG: phosphomannomutase/phosphoglucomutase [Acidobacteria bacterium]|nr:phosphomannomutase/phosphoglucomutase [Acidobacteriota bacterium]